MKTNLFTFESSVGTFWIRPEPAGRVQLGIGRNRLKTYTSPAAASRDVAAHRTGWAAWDELVGEKAPPDLHRWKRPAAAAKRTRKGETDPDDSQTIRNSIG